MKRTILILLCMLLSLSLLAACTPEEKQNTPTVPAPNSPAAPEETRTGESTGTEADAPQQNGTEPAPVTDPAESPSEPGSGAAVPTTEFVGMDIVDEYTEVIDDNVGVGGAG